MRALQGLAIVMILGAARPATPGTGPAYVVIVNSANALTSIDRQFLKQAFLKKRTRWPDGAALWPVDLTPLSPVRERFSREVLERSVAAVRSYWQQLIFSGRDVPPVELDDSAAVVQYVLRNAGAVGYIDPDTALEGTRILSIR
jgi:ABC-type phosphate transport system substrate-binding protein